MKTVKVRIACAVNSRGEWNVSGWSSDKEGRGATDVAIDGLDVDDLGEVLHWITAEIPVPEPQELAGAVEEATR
jgi:hypothetical protein